MTRAKKTKSPPKPCRIKHTPSPDGYLEWHAWAERKSKTQHQVRCEDCGLWAIWVRGPARLDGELEEAIAAADRGDRLAEAVESALKKAHERRFFANAVDQLSFHTVVAKAFADWKARGGGPTAGGTA